MMLDVLMYMLIGGAGGYVAATGIALNHGRTLAVDGNHLIIAGSLVILGNIARSITAKEA